MLIGVPKESKAEEFRVALTPGAALEYISRGHQIVVETRAGSGIGAGDDDYRKVGAKIAESARNVFTSADMIVKVKEPQPGECKLLRKNQILFTFLHLAADRQLTEALIESGCTAVAYETVTGEGGELPLLAPMSEIAGRMAIEAGGVALRKQNGGKGKLLGGVPGVPAAKVVILGGEVVGTQAARMAVGLGSEVTIIDRSLARLRRLDEMFNGRVTTLYSTMEFYRTGGHWRRRGHWGRARSRRQRAQARKPGDGAPNVAGRRDGRRRHRPRRVFRDVVADLTPRADLCCRRDHSLLRFEHAGCRPHDFIPCVGECHAALWTFDRRKGAVRLSRKSAFAERAEYPPGMCNSCRSREFARLDVLRTRRRPARFVRITIDDGPPGHWCSRSAQGG